jgi:hypothetical protein
VGRHHPVLRPLCTEIISRSVLGDIDVNKQPAALLIEIVGFNLLLLAFLETFRSNWHRNLTHLLYFLSFAFWYMQCSHLYLFSIITVPSAVRSDALGGGRTKSMMI